MYPLPPHQDRARARILRPLLALALGVVCAPLAAELLARIWAPQAGADLEVSPAGSVPPGLFVFHDGSSFALPGFEGTARHLHADVSVRINPWGLRGGPELGPSPRWLALGDSFVMALQVPEEDSLVGLLSREHGLNVLNAGFDGGHTLDELDRYLMLDPLVDAQAVIVVLFTGNDLTQNHAAQERIHRRYDYLSGLPLPPVVQAAHERAAQGLRQAPPGAAESSPWARLLRHSYALAYMRVADARARRARSGGAFARELRAFTTEGAGELMDELEITAEGIRRFKEATQARGDRLLLAVAPPRFVMDESLARATFQEFSVGGELRLNAPGQGVLGILSELGVEACDLEPALRASWDQARSPWFKYDGHWNTRGHAIVAQEIARCVARPAEP